MTLGVGLDQALRVIVLAGLLCLVGCEQYEMVNTSDPDTKLVNLKTCNCEIVAKDELKTLREQAEIGKHVNRYQMKNEGFRTWRFDTATGKACIMLTTDADWNKPDTAAQNCAYQ
jgi:hypothetical protein